MTRSYHTPKWLEKQNPCHYCERRHVGCQTGCKQRDEYQAKRHEDYQKFLAVESKEQIVQSFANHCIRKTEAMRRSKG